MLCLCETAVYSPRLNCFLICLIVAFLDAFSWVQLEQIMLKFPQPGIILLEIVVVNKRRPSFLAIFLIILNINIHNYIKYLSNRMWEHKSLFIDQQWRSTPPPFPRPPPPCLTCPASPPAFSSPSPCPPSACSSDTWLCSRWPNSCWGWCEVRAGTGLV